MRILLIDDEPLALAEMSAMLAQYPDVDIVGTADTAHLAAQEIKRLQPDLIFLDINMPGQNGFELLERLDEVPEVVFVTAYDQFALQAFEVNALDYLLKPVNTLRLRDCIQRVRQRLRPTIEAAVSMERRLFIKDGEACHFVPVKEIFLLESVGNYARVYYQQHRPLLHKSLNQLEEKLPGDHFFRANRQFLLNINFIQSIHPYFNSTLQVVMPTGIRVDISQRQSVKFKEKMGI